MIPNKSMYCSADAAEINLYELNFARFFSIRTSENGWRRVVCELVRHAAKVTRELRLEDGTELPGGKTFPVYVIDLMDSYLAVLPDAKPHAYPAAEREQLMEQHCRHTEDGKIDYDYYRDVTLEEFVRHMRGTGQGALYAKRGPFWHGGHGEQCHFEELFPLKRTARDYDLRQDMTLDGYIGRVVFRAQRQLDSGTLPSDSVRFRRLADLVRNDITREAEELFRAWKDAEKELRGEE